jgi:RHS repeat-associated protein
VSKLDFQGKLKLYRPVKYLLAVLLFFYLVDVAQAHLAGPAKITVEVGKFVDYRIRADVSESEPSAYSTLQTPDGNIAELVTPPAFTRYNSGAWWIKGKSVGQTTATFQWEYAPNSASAFHQVIIEVVPRKPRRTSTSGETGDPVNTYSGELYMDEPPDIYLPGPLPLYFQRYYASSLMADGDFMGNLGVNWQHNFEISLVKFTSGTELMVKFLRGLNLQFSKSAGNWVLDDPTGTVYLLREDGTDYVLLNPQDWIRYRFDAAGKLRSIKDRNDNTLTVEYVMLEREGMMEETERIARVSNGLGSELSFFTESFELLSSISDGTRSVSFGVAFNRELQTVTDVADNDTTYTYINGIFGDLDDVPNGFNGSTIEISAGLLKTITRQRGNLVLSVDYDSSGRVKSQRDGLGNELLVVYGEGVTTIEDPYEHITKHAHDLNGRLLSLEDPTERTATFQYDSAGRQTGTVDFLGDASSVTYHPETGRLASRTSASDEAITYTYAAQVQDGFTFYNLTRENHPDGTTVEYTHDSRGNVLTITDRKEQVTTFTYNSRGQILTQTVPGGNTTSYTYNTAGLPLTVTANGLASTIHYDALNRITRVTHPDETYKEFTYDAKDRVLTERDERGSITTHEYDANGNRTKITFPNSHFVTMAYDGMDRLEEVTNETEGVTSYVYDALGRPVEITAPTGEKMITEYDSRGRPMKIENALGHQTLLGFDDESVLSSITNPLGKIWQYTSNKEGHPEKLTTPLGHEVHYGYDVNGNLTSITNTLGQVTRYGYNENGLLASIEVPDGSTLTLARNAFGLVTNAQDAEGRNWVREFNSRNQLIREADPMNREITYTYNGQGLPQEVTLEDGSTLSLTYNATGQLTNRTHSSGQSVSFDYDAEGNMTMAGDVNFTYDESGRLISSNGQTITRDQSGRITAVTYEPGKTVTYSYDARGLLATVTDWIGGVTAFEHDGATQLTRITRPNGSITTYTYDDDGELTGILEENGNRASISLQLDGEGRTINAMRDVPLTPDLPASFADQFTYDVSYQTATYVYDQRGRVTSDGTSTFGWDGGSRLTSIQSGAGQTTFTYDGMGVRTSMVSPEKSRYYVVNHAFRYPSVTRESDGSGTLAYYVYLPDGRLLHRVSGGGARSFYHYDEMGNTMMLSNEANQITDLYACTPYGEVITSQGATDNPFIYAGAYGVMTDDSGLMYMRARYYDPRNAQFISPDPVKVLHPLMMNPYQYALNNPLDLVDPAGAAPEEDKSFTEEYKGGLADIVSETVKNVFEKAAGKSADEAIKAWKLFPKSIPIPNLSQALKYANIAEAAGNLGDVAGFAIDFYEEFEQARKEGKSYVRSGARGLFAGGVDVFMGSGLLGGVNPVVLIVDAFTGENLSHSIKQIYRIPEALLGSSRDARAYAKAVKDGDFGAVVQAADAAGQYYSDRGFFNTVGALFDQGLIESLDAVGYAYFFGPPQPYELSDNALKRIRERQEARRLESERRNAGNRKSLK